MGLFVPHHLQPMLDAPQEQVRRCQFVARLERDPVARREHLEGFERRPDPQFGMSAARDQLLGLREKLDLADSAAADLDVVALDRDVALAAIDLHLPLHVVDVAKRGKVEMLAPDERRDLGDHRLACPRSPAQGRALIMAARSQVRPSRS